MSDQNLGGRQPLSFAKTLDGTHGSEKLDEVSAKVREQFSKAASPTPSAAPAHEQAGPAGPKGPAPEPGGMAYKPPVGTIRREVDGQELNKQLAQQANYLKLNQKANEARQQAAKQVELKNGKQHDDRERGG